MPSSRVMHEFKEGDLHSGSKHGPKVKSRKQAVAIMMSEKRKEGHMMPEMHKQMQKKEKGEKGLSFKMRTKHPKPSGKYY